MTDITLIKFYEDNKNKLIPLYKSSIATWDNYVDDITREMPPLHIIRVKIPNECDIIVLKIDLVDSDIIVGHPVAEYSTPNQLFSTHPTTFARTVKYHCNECKIRIREPCYHCGSCDYDLCCKCAETAPKHKHSLFKNEEYFGLNTYDQCYVVSEYIPDQAGICNFL